jgi:hypothetical protein
MPHGRRILALVGALLLALTSRTGHADVVTESRDRANMMISQTRGVSITRTRADRQCIDFEGREGQLPPWNPHGATSPSHTRTITRLDRRLTWTIDFSDSSYMEVSFELAKQYASKTTSSPLVSEDRKWEAEAGRDTIAGRPTRQYSWTGDAGTGNGTKTRFDIWLAPETPATKELASFSRGADKPRLKGAAPIPPSGIVRRARAVLIPPADSGSVLRNLRAVPDSFRDYGIVPELGGIEVTYDEVTSIRTESVADSLYEIPAGFRRKESGEEAVLGWEKAPPRPAPGKTPSTTKRPRL